MLDAVVIGSGPNGLSAAIVLARAGCKGVVFEAHHTIGGGARSAELTLPGFTHDVCSAVHPFGVASPFWRTLPLAAHGLEWLEPAAMLGHRFDDGSAVVVERSLEATAASLGRDGDAYRKLFGGVAGDWPKLERAVLGPPALPRHPFALARFGLHALRSAKGLAMSAFAEERTRALLAGHAAHGMLPLDRALTGGIGLTLCALCHVAAWRVPRGGAAGPASAPPGCLPSLGREIAVGAPPTSIHTRPAASLALADLPPRPLPKSPAHRPPLAYHTSLERYRYGR